LTPLTSTSGIAREDVEALDENHILFSIGDMQKAFFINKANISGINKAVFECQCRLLHIVVVPSHHMRAFYTNLSCLPSRQYRLSHVKIDNFYYSVRAWFSSGAGSRATV